MATLPRRPLAGNRGRSASCRSPARLPRRSLLAGWLRSRLEHDVELVHEAAEQLESVTVGGEPCPSPRERLSGSDLLSAELDEFGRDPVYEAAALAATASLLALDDAEARLCDREVLTGFDQVISGFLAGEHVVEAANAVVPAPGSQRQHGCGGRRREREAWARQGFSFRLHCTSYSWAP